LFFKKKFLWIVVYLLLRSWDVLLSYLAFLKDPMIFIVGELNRELVEFFIKGEVIFLAYEVVRFFLFIAWIYFMQMLWDMEFRAFPIFTGFFVFSFHFLAPLTWYCPELIFFFEIPLHVIAIILTLVALSESGG
jgi:hypothetical protein